MKGGGGRGSHFKEQKKTVGFFTTLFSGDWVRAIVFERATIYLIPVPTVQVIDML
jgi:hypothetical protein